MVNDEILGGLRLAVEKGQPLKMAMMTFFNSGYAKEEIEEAARILSQEGMQVQAQIQSGIAPAPISSQIPAPSQTAVSAKLALPLVPQTPPQLPPSMPIQQQQFVQQPAQQKNIQKISSYEEKGKDKILIFILVGVLVFLFGILITTIVFKEQLINFFSGSLG